MIAPEPEPEPEPEPDAEMDPERDDARPQHRRVKHRRVVILGGGAGAVTTAFELSKPGWEEHFTSITMYQQGWRLGGKGASGRGPHRRIEEHGLHIWFGFYFNAFEMLRRCHEELDWRARACHQPRWPLAFQSMDGSFSPCDRITISDGGPDWTLWEACFFGGDDHVPWHPDAGATDPTVLDYLVRSLYLVADLLWSLLPFASHAGHGTSSAVDGTRVSGGAATRRDAGVAGHAQRAAGLLRSGADAIGAVGRVGGDYTLSSVARVAIDLVLRALDAARALVRPLVERVSEDDDEVRRLALTIDVLLAIARGMVEDDLIGRDSFASIDGIDMRAWLRIHGASPAAIESALVRTIVYDLSFAYEDGDQAKPRIGAGTSLRDLLLTFFHYAGAVMWKMNAGMGDIVFAPLYELLVKRGVDVRFFHRVERIKTKHHEVTEIEIDRQADVDVPHRAYLTKRGLWPADPRKTLPLPDDIPPAAYESWYMGRDACRVATKKLRFRGDDRDDFDIVVLGMPITCVPLVSEDLMAHRAWRASVDHIKTIPTQALQLWLRRPLRDLSEANTGAVLGGFVEPFDTWADMPQLVSQERVAHSRTVAYFCNAALDSTPPERGSPEALRWLDDQAKLVRDRTIQFLRTNIGALWPAAIDMATGEFDWDLLVAPSESRGVDRLDAQYWRANVEPSERYVLSVPGSSAHRIDPEHTHFHNLYAAGDWTSCKINAGCIEAAVISGRLAANGIHLDHHAAHRVYPVRCWGP